MRMPDVVRSVGLSQATINRLHRAGDFPRKVRIGPNSTGWWESEIDAWKADREQVPRSNERN
ncbi:AlpA family transcriptional regulator [Sphingomonas ginsenosidimutans]|uniref:AlpA family transcriptional regulator n=1 Tax=Sphingomonas ginsenosidimutans TaxID=862134 RepID=A0A2A4HY05_9SPHN|nr:AlpA family transcriptional regulator [Sphingomonas ginsenosidimutans]